MPVRPLEKYDDLSDFASSESNDVLRLLADADEVIQEQERICRELGDRGGASRAWVCRPGWAVSG